MKLCLDLGTTTGWAYINNNSIFSGFESFKHDRYQGGGMRFLKFNNWLDKFISENKVNVVYFEEVRRHVSTDSAHVYGGFMAVLQNFCEKNSIAYGSVPVGTIKKHVAGKGNASKEDVINSINALGYSTNDDNEADAIALALYVMK